MRLALCALVMTISLLAAGTATADPGLYPALDPLKVAQIEHLTRLLDELPQKTYPVTPGNADAYTAQWELEILPWYAYEGISDPVIPPQSIAYFFAPYGPAAYIDGYVFHILGLSACQPAGLTTDPFTGAPTPYAGPIFLNGRYINPRSPWYQRPDLVATLVHELGHSQGICAGPSPYIESSTQIAAAEVMAAMANSGNDQVLLSLLYEYRGIVEGALRYEAIRDGAQEQYDALQAAMDHYSAREAAIHAASTRYWARPENAGQLVEILRKYEWIPYLKLAYGIHQGYLHASFEQGYLTQAQTYVPSGEDLQLDDLVWFLGHADERVAEVAAHTDGVLVAEWPIEAR